MGYRVKGTLKLPDGTPGTNCEIEFTSRKNFTPMLTGMGVSIRTDSAGAYDVTLEYGAYAVILRTGNTYPTAIGQLTVGPDTVAGQDLPTLLEQSGWQPATPEYIKQITEWLNRAESAAVSAEASAVKASTDGAAQAALAKSQADRAKSEADRASKISGLETVADAIGLAALPLPDVWAPLSDSLRLITGYGRDVLVGSDVVARMVNFSRNSTATYIGKDGQLKTAAANEPRFEKEGLLIEGQSTNLFPWSQEFIGKWLKVDGVASPDVNFPNAISLNDSVLGYVHTRAVGLNVGSPYSILAIVKGYVEGSTDIKGIFANGGQDSSKVVGRYGPYTVLSFVRNAAVNTNADVTGLTWAPGKATGIVLCALQIEALPFSSSYIPTNGAAVTRAADVCSVQLAGNFVVPATIGCNYNLLSANRSGLAPAQLLGFKAGDKACDGLLVKTSPRPLKLQSLNEFDGGLSPGATCQLFGTAVFRAANGVRNEFSSGALGVPTQGDWKGQTLGNTLFIGRTESSDNDRYLFGHIRNLRIWHRALTDDQIKAVA